MRVPCARASKWAKPLFVDNRGPRASPSADGHEIARNGSIACSRRWSCGLALRVAYLDRLVGLAVDRLSIRLRSSSSRRGLRHARSPACLRAEYRHVLRGRSSGDADVEARAARGARGVSARRRALCHVQLRARGSDRSTRRERLRDARARARDLGGRRAVPHRGGRALHRVAARGRARSAVARRVRFRRHERFAAAQNVSEKGSARPATTSASWASRSATALGRRAADALRVRLPLVCARSISTAARARDARRLPARSPVSIPTPRHRRRADAGGRMALIAKLRPYAPAAAIAALAIFIAWAFAATTLFYTRPMGLPLDDSYIYLTYAKQFRRGREATFTYFPGGALGGLDERVAVADVARAVLDARRAAATPSFGCRSGWARRCSRRSASAAIASCARSPAARSPGSLRACSRSRSRRSRGARCRGWRSRSRVRCWSRRCCCSRRLPRVRRRRGSSGCVSPRRRCRGPRRR